MSIDASENSRGSVLTLLPESVKLPAVSREWILNTMRCEFQPKMAGMTLLEVILSLALLGGSLAVIGEIARTSFQNARTARDLIQAELLAESILAKVQLGIIKMEPAVDIPVGTGSIIQTDVVADTHAFVEGNTAIALWLYSVEVVYLEDYLVEIAVTVRQNVAEERHSLVCRLVRWLALEPEEEEEE